MKSFSKVGQIIVGVIFLLSALLKATETATFANLMSDYGASWLGFGAPLIILTEALLGIMLIFGYNPRHVSMLTGVFLLMVSSIYSYGVLVKDITNCGCFGPLTWLNTKPWLTFVRNGLLFAFLIPSMIKQQKPSTPTIPSIAFIALVSVVIMFMCGYSFRGANCLRKQHTYQPVAVSDSPLAEWITTKPDSSYLVFAFSYNCPFCLNSIGNVNQYTQLHAVDRVIGLAVKDAEMETRFHDLFETNFEIRNISSLDMYRIAPTLPVAFLIRRDTIIRRYDGVVMSPAIHKMMIP